jgi:hypothetical protein
MCWIVTLSTSCAMALTFGRFGRRELIARARRACTLGQGDGGRCCSSTDEYVSRTVPRLRTIALVALIVVLTDVTWDGTSLRISIGLPGRRRLVQVVLP